MKNKLFILSINNINNIIKELLILFMDEETIQKFIQYRNCIFYNPLEFSEVINNGFEIETFSRTYLTKLRYRYQQKNQSEIQIKKNLLDKLYNKKFYFYKLLDKNLILTNNKYPYVSTNNNPMFIIWDIFGKTNILDIKQIVNKYFSNYNYLVWRNPYMHQSVKLIKHYHVVIRNPIIKPKLTKVLLLTRHGPREPIHLPSKFDSSYWSFDRNTHEILQSKKARMTCLGKSYCQYRGQEAFNYYSHEIDFSKLTRNDILIESSYIERTRESAVYYMKSFGHNFNDKDIIISSYLASDKLFNLLELLAYNKFQDNYKIDMDTEKLDILIEEITGQSITNSMDYFHIYSTIKCYKVHNYLLPDGLDKIYDLLEQMATLMYNEVNDPNNNIYSKKIGIKMLFHIFELLKTNKKFIYLSSHDNMIIALLKYICYKYNVNIKLFDIPDFCSCIRFEIWNDDILRIYYDSLFLLEVKYTIDA